MSVEEESMGQHGVAFDRYDDFDGAADPAGISTPQDKDREFEPHLGLEFAYVDAAKTFYNEYAKRVGFTTRVNQIARPTSDVAVREYSCATSGDGCNAMLRIESKGQNSWAVTKFVKEHNHSITNTCKGHYHRQQRHFSGATKDAAGVMSVEEERMGKHGVAFGRYDDLDGAADPAGISTAQDKDRETEPHLGLEFAYVDAAKTFYNEYAKRVGFTICVNQITRPTSDVAVREFSCATSGDGCNATLRIESKGQNSWVVTKFVKEHNHSVTNTSKVHYHRQRRHVSGATKIAVESYPMVGVVPSGVMYLSMDGNRVPAETNRGSRSASMESNRAVQISDSIANSARHATSKRSLGRDAQNLLDYLRKMQAENPGFYYAIQLDEDNRMSNVFWADARSRTAYSHFGDAITLDTMYRVKQYKVPFAPFTGINHHGQTILFGCALLLDDSECTFTWLFKTFLAAMGDQAPVSIITDPEKSIQAAVAQVFPGTRHCISKWHVLREGPDRLAHVCHMHPNFQAELYNCINLTETIEEFETAWDLILDRYDLRRNDWLQLLYAVRQQWVPSYFHDTFFAAISFNQGSESSFFVGYVNEHTTVPLFFRQYERALENSFEKEIEADFDTICTTPILRTPSPMEKQAASLYTKTIFSKFQEELVETFVYTANRIDGDGAVSTFRVAKFEDDQKAYLVSLNIEELRASCSCQMFEYSGILCRHILTVFTVTNVLTLPSHYILKRWTRNAKCNIALEERADVNGQESLAIRYNQLLREAIKFSEEGAIAPDTFTVAMAALREGGEKVAAVKTNVASFAPPSSQVSVIGYDSRKTTSSAPDMTPLLWPRQDEVTRRFNLNDAGLLAQSVTDLNLPRMAPVSLRRDDGHPDNMVILPCLKSMTWVMENRTLAPANRVAVINLKLQDHRRSPASESEVKFQLSTLTLEPMLRSMAYINEQLSAPANRVAVINLKLQDTDTSSGESEVKFQVSRDTLGAMLRSMAYIREQLSNSNAAESASEIPSKRPRKERTN
ncbi:protein FAR1-RELATED SEQUENCE 3 isoform X2 [Cynara cardunculus var. scolymus]|nr:protein FAR1-RELATED SEQUENCE 3 isoform X2 [Cynara cardunculus var. scolymus]XP_024963983.1 protein FAR1-RELATED SEQUENCE 3 isoform X2 [Cynara cardunculus var. scolymus]XP_024963984.1 protein FAR1-RELATED SEQUENCE 3 isoform X2 [Cynara cardunculus var. scolymus]